MRRLCKVLEVHPSGFYAWRVNPESRRVNEDKRLLVPIKESWELNGNRIARVPNRVEDILDISRHFDDQRHAKQFFSEVENISGAMETLVTSLLPPA